jgi:PAS domain S-box-containing protein
MDKSQTESLEARAMKILVVEDEFITATELKSDLLKLGYEVPAIADTAEEAILKAAELRPDLILMDIKLIGPMTGIDAAEEIRKSLKIPTIYLTAHMDPKTLEHAKKTDPFGFLPKPCRIDTLKSTIEIALYKSKADEQRKEAERLLAESEARFRRITEGLTDYQYTVHVEKGRAIETTHSPACAAVTGYTAKEFDADPYLWIKMVAPEDRQLIISRVEQILRGNDIAPIEHRIIRKDGTLRWVRDNIILHKDSSGTLLSYDGVVKDITEHKLSDEALRESEERFRNVYNTAPLAFVLWDREARVTGWNNQAEKMFGWTREEIIGRNFFDFIIPESARLHVQDIVKLLIEGNLPSYSINENITKSGRIIMCEWNNSLIRGPGGSIMGAISLGLDITERKKLEAQLLQAQKMESIGILAGGVAHDFNNILTAIIGFGSVARKRLKDDDQTREFIDEMLAGAQRAAELTNNLLAFSRKQNIVLKQEDLNAIVRKINKMLVRIIGEDIGLNIMLINRELPVLIDTGQIEHVLMNLVSNARDAMPDGGALIIRTDMIDVDDSHAAAHLLENTGMYAVLTVSDTGIGMDDRIKESIFEPFFTTKEVGKGTGLGLSMGYGIVKQHGGNIDMHSEPGKGATFNIYLPIVKTAVAEKFETDQLVPFGRGETILIAEDDASVRKIIRMCLEEHGYKVIEAENGEEAIGKYIEHFIGNKEWLPLLLFDVIMPSKNGRDAYEEIKAMSPDTKVIFMSGYKDDVIEKMGILQEDFAFIAKPIDPEALLRKIGTVLGNK